MADTFSDIALFKASLVTTEGQVIASSTSLGADQLLEKQLTSAQKRLASLLPVGNLSLTPDEQNTVRIYQEARLVLGAAGAAPMICKGPDCPFHQTCPLFIMEKAPVESPCPFESNYVTERFLNWMIEIGRTLETLAESERAVLSNLVYLDLQEQRMVANLSRANNALLESRSVKDVDAEGQVIAWEDVIHISQQNLQQITTQRRMLMKDFELTPEQKTRKQKWLGVREETDIARRQSQAYARLQKRKQKPAELVVIDGTATTV